MVYDPTQEQKDYINKKGKLVLHACPGSGKTTTIGYKLAKLCSNWTNAYSGFIGIACLSFTNVAKDEIQKKFEEAYGSKLSFPHIVSTIDSFINNYLTLPFSHLLLKRRKRPRILEDSSIINRLYEQSGQIFRYRNRKNSPLFYTYSADKIEYNINGGYYFLRYNPDPEKVDQSVFQDYCKDVKQWQIKNGLLKSTDSAYIAYHLLKKYPKIASWLSTRFPYMIIDEAQDTSEIQDAIFKELIDAGLSHIEFVGDPYQAIFEWRDAKPELFINKIEDVKTWHVLPLTENKRSTQQIVDAFSIIRKERDQNIISTCKSHIKPDLTIIKYDEGNLNAVIPVFRNLCKELGISNRRIVVRGEKHYKKLIGYNKNIQPWKSGSSVSELLKIQALNRDGRIKEAINNFRRFYISLKHSDLDHDEKIDIEKSLKQDNNLNAYFYNLLSKLPDIDLSIKEWSMQISKLITDEFDLNFEVSLKRPSNKSNSTFKPGEEKISIIELFADRKSSELEVSTIHQVKGKTFEGLLLILDKDSKGQSLSLGDIKPSNRIPEEKQRLIYVAMSRPQYLLALGIPNSIPNEQINQKFGENIKFIEALYKNE